jgi:drug/metabolite transporter (DMT)-like permease
MILIAIGLIAAFGQLIMTEGYKHIVVSKGSVLHMLIPVINMGIGYYIFRESFTIRELIGSVMVILACAGAISSKSLKFKFFGPR